MPNSKPCLRCARDLPPASFARCAANSDGLQRWCRACTKAWKAENRTRVATRNRRYEQANPDRVKVWKHRWRSANLAREQAKERARIARWRAENPELAKILKALGRDRLKGVPGSCSAPQMLARIEYFGRRCWMCGAPWEQIDHVKPLNKGGTNWPSNIRPACGDCNLRKRDTWPLCAAMNPVASHTRPR